MSEPKDVRIQLLLSKSEAEAIDEWRYEQRVPNRNEAIRRLIGMGLLMSKSGDLVLLLSEQLNALGDEGGGLENDPYARATVLKASHSLSELIRILSGYDPSGNDD